MASIKSAKKRKRENGKIYVSGYVDGLETGYNYCIMYSYNDGPMKNMGHGGMSYTFISLASLPKGSSKRYSFSESGSWVTDEGDGTYKIICNMVGGRCEDVHVQESSRSFSVAAPYTPPTPPPPTCDEGAIVCEYNEAEGRYMLKKCVNGKLVYEKWCGASDTCEGGVCVPPAGVTPPTPPTPHGAVPIVTPTTEKKYLSRDEATVRINAGLPCYIKCVLPVLDTLPGIPYTPGAWVPPLCAITTTA